ncbi:hypothetical protein RRG08_015292 [Elysia crispata]|uniref:Uncharacterized protein n=1 Tax=Elysia crispata TaxID=231223 RepID=A0AAE0ZTU4_9GAST|nr:hypothetical protein RRG08_015292 [Elysia crispata]
MDKHCKQDTKEKLSVSKKRLHDEVNERLTGIAVSQIGRRLGLAGAQGWKVRHLLTQWESVMNKTWESQNDWTSLGDVQVKVFNKRSVVMARLCDVVSCLLWIASMRKEQHEE